MMAPAFWTRKRSIAGVLLAPVGFVYGLGAMLRAAMASPFTAPVPVLCIGNFTLGGTGKTPTVIYASKVMREHGHTPFVVTRGYGGKLRGPHLVDPAEDGAAAVGDEALLHARATPTVIAWDKVEGIKKAVALGASVILLDDGMQNPRFSKTLTLAVVDASLGFGNRRVFPAGPLRAPLSWQEKRIDGAIVIHAPKTGLHDSLATFKPYVTFSAQLKAARADWLNGARVLAFCGIGNPQKFHTTLTALSARIVRFKVFPDHYIYDAGDAKELIEEATRQSLTLVTTEKDHVRLQGQAETRARLAGLANTVQIEFQPDDEPGFAALLLKAAPVPQKLDSVRPGDRRAADGV